MNQKTCPKCLRVYRTLGEITQAGGEVYRLGLAQKARCKCGQDLGSVGNLWRKAAEQDVKKWPYDY